MDCPQFSGREGWQFGRKQGARRLSVEPFLMHELADLWCFDFETTHRDFKSGSNDLYSSLSSSRSASL